MKTGYVQDIKVLSSRVGVDLKIGLVDALNILQDNMCEYFKNIGCDGVTMIPKVGCFFALSKTKIHFEKSPKWLDEISLSTDICKLTGVRLNLVNNIVHNGNICISSIQEMCAMDSSTRKLRTIETTLLPHDIELVDANDLGGFTRFNEEVSDDNLVEVYKIKVSNIDMYRHTNNVQYVQIMLDTLTLNELECIEIVDFEIHYVNESRYGDEIKIYRKHIDNSYYFELRYDNNVISKALLKYRIIEK